MIDTQKGRGVLNVKLGFFYVFMMVDIILSTFVEPHFSPNNEYLDSGNIQIYVICSIQIGINLILNVQFLILMWQTVPLRYGMIFDLLKQFKLAIFLILIQFALVTVERVIRIMSNSDLVTYNSSVAYYYIIYYAKYIIYPLYYAILLQSSLKLALPVYYNVKKWDSNL